MRGLRSQRWGQKDLRRAKIETERTDLDFVGGGEDEFGVERGQGDVGEIAGDRCRVQVEGCKLEGEEEVEGRNPKSEIRKKAEARNPKGERDGSFLWC
jgi:hypothetical protein